MCILIVSMMMALMAYKFNVIYDSHYILYGIYHQLMSSQFIIMSSSTTTTPPHPTLPPLYMLCLLSLCLALCVVI